MMENDIDKIFKRGLHDAVEPTTASDWQAFEKTLIAAPFYKSAWFLGVLAVLLVATSAFSVYTFVNAKEPVYSSRMIQENGVETNKKVTLTDYGVENASLGQNNISNVNEPSESLSQDPQDGNASISETAMNGGNLDDNINISSTSGQVNEVTAGENKQSKNNDAYSAASANGLAARNNNELTNKSLPRSSSDLNSAVKDKDSSVNDASKAMVEVAASANDKGLLAKDRNSTQATNKFKTDDQTNLQALENDPSRSQTSTSNTEMAVLPIQNASAISPLGANVSRDALDFELLEDNIKLGQPKINSFGYAVFFGLEQNSILNTSPSFGLVLRKSFSKWSAEAGIAYMQSGKLVWTQNSETVSYGFDRYENAILLRTDKTEYVSMPLKMSYRIGGQSQVFAGFSPSILVNARQEKLVFNDGTLMTDNTEKGYLYNTGAPDFIYFMSAGYTYSLSEQFQFDFGLNYSLQEWKTSEKQPVGGFVKFYYTFR